MKTLSVLALTLTIVVALPVHAAPSSSSSGRAPPAVRSHAYTPPPSAEHQHWSAPASRGMTNREKRDTGGPGFVPWHSTPNRQPGTHLWHCDQSRFNDDECRE